MTADPRLAVEDLDGEIGPKDLRRFVTVLRGYDRIEVDECLLRIADAVTSLRAELEAERQARLECTTSPAEETAPSGLHADGFGIRAERLLRLAETEAREIRTNAAREAAALLERARAAVERERHEAEQETIARSARQDQEFAERTSGLLEGEQHIAVQLAALKSASDAARAAVQRDISALRAQTRTEIAELRGRAAAEIASERDLATREVERLRRVAADVRGDLNRLVDFLLTRLPVTSPSHAGRRSSA